MDWLSRKLPLLVGPLCCILCCKEEEGLMYSGCGSSTIQSLCMSVCMCVYVYILKKKNITLSYSRSSNLIFSNCVCPLWIFQQMLELSKNVRELKSILYGNSESEPVAEACAQLTQEFFRENTLRLLIKCLPKLNLEVIGMGPIAFLGFPCKILG